MSSTYFSKKFKKVTGFGFKEYVNNIRLKEASNLLLETKYSITNIALKCGFTDSNYFGDFFKKMKGVSPNKYRKNKGTI
jgi:AraC-like DNA-binding protein